MLRYLSLKIINHLKKMKYLFTYVFLCFFFGSVLTENIPRYKLARLGLALRKLKLHKEEMRKLQESTDDGSYDEYLTDTDIPPSDGNYTYNSTEKEPESGTSNTEDGQIPADTPVSVNEMETENKDKGIQIMKFHNYVPNRHKFTFSVFFFFLNQPIPRFIIFRIRITYTYRFRFLNDDNMADSVKTTCSLRATQLKDNSYPLGKTVEFDCSGNSTKDLNETSANITLNTDLNMVTVSGNGTMSEINFKEVNFNANSTDEASNIQDNNLQIDRNASINYLRNGTIITDVDKKHTLRIVGKNKTDIGNELYDGEEVRMILKTSNRRGEKRPEQFNCVVNRSTADLILDCDISHKSINTSAKDLHLSISNDTNQILTLQMADSNNTEPIIITSANNIVYRRNSGGLSGGAIAGIIIACVVVLLAASIATIMLKRPKKSDENTTIIGLKTIDN